MSLALFSFVLTSFVVASFMTTCPSVLPPPLPRPQLPDSEREVQRDSFCSLVTAMRLPCYLLSTTSARRPEGDCSFARLLARLLVNMRCNTIHVTFVSFWVDFFEKTRCEDRDVMSGGRCLTRSRSSHGPCPDRQHSSTPEGKIRACKLRTPSFP